MACVHELPMTVSELGRESRAYFSYWWDTFLEEQELENQMDVEWDKGCYANYWMTNIVHEDHL